MTVIFPSHLFAKFVCTCFIIVGVASPTLAQTGFNQPRMQEALDALYAARSSLEQGAHNKGGYRLHAISDIDRAIRDVKAGIRYAF